MRESSQQFTSVQTVTAHPVAPGTRPGEPTVGDCLAVAQEPDPAAMAISDGGPLTIPEGAPATLTEALLRTATANKDRGIRYIQRDGSELFQPYAALLEEAKRLLAGLYASGLRPHDRVILQIDGLKDHFTTFWACVLGGITPVTVAVAPSYQETNGVVNKLYNTWELLGSPASGYPPILTSRHLVEPISGLPALFSIAEGRPRARGPAPRCAPPPRPHSRQPPARPAARRSQSAPR